MLSPFSYDTRFDNDIWWSILLSKASVCMCLCYDQTQKTKHIDLCAELYYQFWSQAITFFVVNWYLGVIWARG